MSLGGTSEAPAHQPFVVGRVADDVQSGYRELQRAIHAR
jgi:hypothetical protein